MDDLLWFSCFFLCFWSLVVDLKQRFHFYWILDWSLEFNIALVNANCLCMYTRSRVWKEKGRMSEVFDGYERQYCEISASLSKKCTSAGLLDGGDVLLHFDLFSLLNAYEDVIFLINLHFQLVYALLAVISLCWSFSLC